MAHQKENRRQRTNGLMCGKPNHNGFTLLEILIAIALMAIIAMVVVPSLTRLGSRHERTTFIGHLQALVQGGWQAALASGKMYRVHIDVDKRVITLGVETGAVDNHGEPLFNRVPSSIVNSVVRFPASIQIKHVFIEGFDEMTRAGSGRKTSEVWFYIMPDGLTQHVIIQGVDAKDLRNGKPRPFTMSLSPFTATFQVTEGAA